MPKLHKVKNFVQQVQKTNKFFNYRFLKDKDKDIDMVYQYLDCYLEKIFPDQDSIDLFVKNFHFEKIKESQKDSYCIDNTKKKRPDFIAYHLYENEWLINYIKTLVNKKNNQFSDEVIAGYLQSTNFIQARDAYLQRYFRAKIKYFMTKDYIENFDLRISEPYTCKGFIDFKHRIDCDECFREHLRCCFTLDGFTYQIAEEAIERNAEMWRPQCMRQAIENYYRLKNIEINDDTLSNLKKEYINACYQYREYKYYTKYHLVIDRLGLATRNMKNTPREVIKLKNKIQKINKAINSYLSQNWDALNYKEK